MAELILPWHDVLCHGDDCGEPSAFTVAGHVDRDTFDRCWKAEQEAMEWVDDDGNPVHLDRTLLHVWQLEVGNLDGNEEFTPMDFYDGEVPESTAVTIAVVVGVKPPVVKPAASFTPNLQVVKGGNG